MRFTSKFMWPTGSTVIAGLAMAVLPPLSWAQSTQAVNSPSSVQTLQTIVVTAEKRRQNIQDVGMSITAVSGGQLQALGIHDPTELPEVTPGLTVNQTSYGTLVFSIRGIGFQSTSLASPPTVGLYLDQAPIPYASEALGAGLDAERVEVLKGPQGTLYGLNATGGAIDYIANQPTDEFKAGVNFSYGRFDESDIEGFVSGPVATGLDMRAAIRVNESGPWQQSYAPQAPQSIGGKDFINGRISALWRPNDTFKSLLMFNAWRDRGYVQEGQYYGFAEVSSAPALLLSPGMLDYPAAPHNDQAADFNSCVNTSPFDPIVGQANGAQWLTPVGTELSVGPGSTVRAGGQPVDCEPPRKNNTYYNAILRMDQELSPSLTLTSLTSYQRFDRNQGIDMSGIPYQIQTSIQLGFSSYFYQELRLAGQFWSRGHWMVGANYASDHTLDKIDDSEGAASYDPTIVYSDGTSAALTDLSAGSPDSPYGVFTSHVGAFAVGSATEVNDERNATYAAFVNGDYPIVGALTFQAGARFTQDNMESDICYYDGGDGALALALYNSQVADGSTSPFLPAPGGCSTVGFAAQNYNPPPGGFVQHLDQNNVSWRTGLNWKLTPDELLYVNVSKGYKSGSFPTLPYTSATEIHPAVQEALLAYEVGLKSTMFDNQLVMDGAAFYYSYTNKQLMGDIEDPLFGALPALVNIPRSHVVGFEWDAHWSPTALRGLTVSPAVSYQDSRIDSSSQNNCSPALLAADGSGGACIAGRFYNFDEFGQYTDFTGDKFPETPMWQPSLDLRYAFPITQAMSGYFRAHYTYNTKTNGGLVNHTPRQPIGPAGPDYPNDPLEIRSYGLLDLQAGLTVGAATIEFWGRNVTDVWYWTSAVHFTDSLLRYTGMPATYGVTVSYNFN